MKAYPRVLFLALAIGLAACAEPEPVQEADKALFLRVADLAIFGVQYPDPAAGETFSKKKQLDGSYELTYKFQNAAGQRPLYLYGRIVIGLKDSDATVSEGAQKLGLLIGLTKEGVVEREVPGMRTGKLTLLVKDERPFGNVYTVRDGAKTHLLMVAGLHVDDPATWEKLMAPKLQQLSQYSGKT